MSISQYEEAVSILSTRKSELADAIMQSSVKDESIRNYTPYQKQKCLQDINYNLQYLSEALQLNSDSLWEDYIRWLKFLLLSLGLNKYGLAGHFSVMAEVLQQYMPPEAAAKIRALTTKASEIMLSDELFQSRAMSESRPYYAEATKYMNYLLSSQKYKALELINELADGGVPIRNIHLDILQPVQREIGNLWHANKISVAQEHYCTGLTQLAIAQLYPRLFNADPKRHSMIGTCVSGELHEIGLRMVTDIMELDGWDTTYLGANMPNEAIVNTIAERKVDLVAISVTFPLNLHKAEDLISRIRSHPDTQKAKILVGGYPFINDPSLWQKIGADNFAADANLASNIADSMMEVAR
ncbi:MAG TPA: cobalamin-dependent protein [Candidatus Cloacimonadota bacterium]|nr:cobalamin-dependent protein [Candidatus Cloacimonadota bacterium]